MHFWNRNKTVTFTTLLAIKISGLCALELLLNILLRTHWTYIWFSVRLHIVTFRITHSYNGHRCVNFCISNCRPSKITICCHTVPPWSATETSLLLNLTMSCYSFFNCCNCRTHVTWNDSYSYIYLLQLLNYFIVLNTYTYQSYCIRARVNVPVPVYNSYSYHNVSTSWKYMLWYMQLINYLVIQFQRLWSYLTIHG